MVKREEKTYIYVMGGDREFKNDLREVGVFVSNKHLLMIDPTTKNGKELMKILNKIRKKKKKVKK